MAVVRFSFLWFLLYFVSLVQGCSEGSIRLYRKETYYHPGGKALSRGAVQYCYSGSWYYACRVKWGCPEANVACRQLGYFGASSYYYGQSFDYGYSNPRENYYSCYGYESSLKNCDYFSESISCLYSSNFAGVNCAVKNPNDANCSESGSVQLIGGATDSEGVLQYCYKGAWVQFCSLGDKEAIVACKQLGFQPLARFISLDDLDSWERGYSPITISCSSHATESELSSCSVSASHSYYSSCISKAPKCTSPKAIRCYREGSLCTDGSVRLVNGSIYQEGRVEICVDGVWGSVCSSGWDTTDARVICKQLGYPDSEPVVSLNGKYGVGDGPIYFSHFSCQGWEHTLTICSKSSNLHFTCSNTAIAGVLCTDGCTEGAVRLVGGSVSNEGTVEICHDNLWGLITDAGWDNKDAMVICRQLKFSSEGAVALIGSRFGKPDRAIHYSYTRCYGGEQSMANCSKVIAKRKNSNSPAAGVKCLPPTPIPNLSCNDKNVPLTRGNECTEGIFRLRQQNMLQYCYKGHWSVLCAFTHKEALVACFQMGYNTSWGLVGEVVCNSTNQSLLQNITCTTSHSISDCIINEGSCTCQKVISLTCFEPTGCEEGAVRITDGLIENEGRLEVCAGGVWGSVCDDGWDKTDAHVACQQLGFSELEPEAFYGSTFGVSTGPIVYSNVKCGGWETSLNECAKTNYIDFTCTGDRIAGALCVDGCRNGDIRLSGYNQFEGIVQICVDNIWGVISGESWTNYNSLVICRQLGYKKSRYGVIHGKQRRAVFLSNVSCNGMESSLGDCDKVLYPLNIAKQLANTTDEIAAVACIVETRSTTFTVTQSSKSTQSNVRPTMDFAQNKHDFRNDPYFISLCVLAGVLLIVVCVILGSKVRNSRRKKRLASHSLPLQTTQPEPRSKYQKVDESDSDNNEPEIQEHHHRYYQRHRQYHSRHHQRHHQHSQNDFPVTSQKEAYSIKRTLVLQEERVRVVQKVIN